MYFHSPEELERIVPICDGVWDKEHLYEYLVWHADIRFMEYIDSFFDAYLDDEDLADMLFSFLLDDRYDGSDSQMGAARMISKMDRQLLRKKKGLLLQAQRNEVYWKRPFQDPKELEQLIIDAG